MRVDDLRHEGGERSARLRWAGGERRLRVAVPAEMAVEGEDLTQFAPLALMLAMRLREPLELDGPVSRRLLDALPETQELLSAWAPSYARVPVRVAAVAPAPAPAAERAACFSRGFDSLYTAVRPRPAGAELTRLVYAGGFDPAYGAATRAERVAGARAAAAAIGLPLTVVEIDLAEAIEGTVDFDDAYGAALAAIGLSLAPAIGALVLPSARGYGAQLPNGSHPLLDPRWSSERVAIEHDSVALGRPAKIEWLVRNRPELLGHVRVCYAGDRATNCGECLKCTLAMIPLEIAGGLERAGSFPPRLDLERVRKMPVPGLVTRVALNDAYVAMPAGPRFDALRDAVAATLRASAGLAPAGGSLAIGAHQNRLYEAILRGHPISALGSGPRLPPVEVGALGERSPARDGPDRRAPRRRAGLVVGVEAARRAHVYGLDRLPAGAAIGELGALLREPGEGTLPLELDAGGLPLVPGRRGRRRVAPGARLRWAVAPLGWREHGLAARVRSVARRLVDATRAAGARPGSAVAISVGWLHGSARAPDRVPLWAAVHPVVDDVLLSSDPADATRLGYGAPTLLGYLEATAPATGALGVRRPPLAWVARWGVGEP